MEKLKVTTHVGEYSGSIQVEQLSISLYPQTLVHEVGTVHVVASSWSDKFTAVKKLDISQEHLQQLASDVEQIYREFQEKLQNRLGQEVQ